VCVGDSITGSQVPEHEILPAVNKWIHHHFKLIWSQLIVAVSSIITLLRAFRASYRFSFIFMRKISQIEVIRIPRGMKFRPCIDLHNGVVKQIVGSSLSENAEVAPIENFVAKKPAADFARFDGVLYCNLPSWRSFRLRFSRCHGLTMH
jgi:hypothetical protein